MTRTTRVAKNISGWTRGETHDLSDHIHLSAPFVYEDLDQGDLNRESSELFAHHGWGSPVDLYYDDSATKHRPRVYRSRRSWPEKRQYHFTYRLSKERASDLVRTWERKDETELTEGWHEWFRALHQFVAHFGLREDPDQKEREKNLRKLEKSKNQDEVLAILEAAGYSRQVDQLRQYLVDREEGLEEDEHPGVRFDSLRAVSRFLISQQDLPFSAIKADYDGYADLEWFLSSRREEGDDDDIFWGKGDGQIVLRFVTPDMIEFAMLSGPWVEGAERLSLEGTLSHGKMRIILDMFLKRMVSYG